MLELILMSKTYGTRPSEFVAGLSGYEAYCLDSAAALYIAYLNQGKKPITMEEDATKLL